jgi:hypothetical protein
MWRLRRQANCASRSLTPLRGVRMLATHVVLFISTSALNFVLEFSTETTTAI